MAIHMRKVAWASPGKHRLLLAAINAVRNGRSSPGCNLQDEEFWGRLQSDTTLVVTRSSVTLTWYQPGTREAAT